MCEKREKGNRRARKMGAKSIGHVDLRVKRSQAAIRGAVVSLLSEMPTQDITAKKTFYAHYPSVQAVLMEIENDAVEEVSGIVESGDVSTPAGLSKVLARLKDLAADGATAFGSLVGTPARTVLAERMRRELSERLSRLSAVSAQFSESLSSRLSCAVDFAAGGIVTLLGSWLLGERSMSEDELSQTVIQSARSCLGSARSAVAGQANDSVARSR